MKTKIILSSCFLAFIGVFLYLYASRPSSDSLLAKLPDAPSAQYILDWEDDFKANTLDTTKWSRVERHTAIPWRSYMTTDDRLYRHRNGYLRLYCIRNNGVIKNDTARVLTGGIWTRDKRAIGFGKVEVRARMTSAMGLWPAIWLTSHELGEDNPKHAEIDLL
jgi:beta-glucanase (GH16 family)